jgi:DNA-binding CsgD family transcriptional regulator
MRACAVQIGAGRYVLVSFTRDGSQLPLRLTAAERQIAAALLSGLSNAAIGRLRGSSPRTVANQTASLYRKLGVHSRGELAARWARSLSPVTE